MKLRTTLILLVLVLGLGAFIVLVERKGQSTRQREEEARKVLQFGADRLSYLRFETSNLVVECARQGDEWTIVQPVRARAASAAIDRILAGLENLPRGDVITREERHVRGLTAADYGLDPPRATITLGDNMHRRTLLVGRHTLLGGNLFVRDERRDDIITTSTNLLSLIPAGVSDVRDRSLFRFGPERVQRLEIATPGGFVQVAQTGKNRWMIQQPLMTRASATAVLALLDSLFEARIQQFVSDSGVDLVGYGLDFPEVKVTIGTGEKEGESTLLIGDAIKTNGSLVYAALKAGNSVYAVSTGLLSRLQINLDDLRDTRVLSIPTPDIAYVRAEEGGQSVELVRKGRDWEVTKPKAWPADAEQVRGLLADWTGATILRFVDGASTNLAELGLAPPARTLVFAREAPAAGEGGADRVPIPGSEVRILVSAENRAEGRILVAVDGELSLYEIADKALRAVSMDPLFYRDRSMLSLNRDDIVRITVEANGVRQVVERSPSGAFIPSGETQYALNPDAVQGMLIIADDLRAAEFVADAPADLTSYGLNPPGGVITFGLRNEAGISRSILLGADAGGKGVYAMVRGRDVVFLVEKAIRGALLQPLFVLPSLSVEVPVDTTPKEQRTP